MRRHRKSAALALAASLISFAGCKTGPRVTVCVLDPARGMAECSSADGDLPDRPIAELDRWGCMNANDWRALLDYCKRGPRK